MSDASTDELKGLDTALKHMGINKDEFDKFREEIKNSLHVCKTCGGNIDSLNYVRCPSCGCDSYGMWGNIHA
jgi:rubrerythrin